MAQSYLGSMTSPLSSNVRVSVMMSFFALFVLIVGPTSCLALSLRSITSEGPPARPAQFNNVDELNKYLAALTEYYTVLGRPRFGKRGNTDIFEGLTSPDSSDDNDDQDNYDMNDEQNSESGPYQSLLENGRWRGLSFPYRQLMGHNVFDLSHAASTRQHGGTPKRWHFNRHLHLLKKISARK